MNNVSEFSNGLTDDHVEEIAQLRIDLGRIIERIDALPRHRSLSLAITKIEEAGHWLRDRTVKSA